MPICKTAVDDCIFWTLTSSGNYSVKSGYAVCLASYLRVHSSLKDGSRVDASTKAFCKKRLWHLPGPQVWKILVWRILTDSLSVGAEFVKRNLFIGSACPWCGEDGMVETLELLFRDCFLVKRLWACSSIGISTEFTSSVRLRDWIINWINYFFTKDDSSNTIIRFLSVLWSLWRIRNEIMFLGKSFSLEYFFSFLSNTTNVALEAESRLASKASTLGSDCHGPLGTLRNEICNHFPFFLVGEKGTCALFRVKVDASWVSSFHASAGWIVYAPNGECYGTFAKRFDVESALQAEAIGIREVLRWATRSNILHLDLSSDCLQLLLQLARVEAMHHLVRGILHDMESDLLMFHCICISFLPRRLNKVAHNLARAKLGL
ncbi:uncharacterized protein LOC141651213 [Silene latifolia]|uniref:uncharacterized protein LOC141651213 n=1 Tax=Silene latifolia TaxID=37657 RepID=UPI003D7791B4